MTALSHQPAPTGGEFPSVSVVIPTYNNLSLLLECIESLLRQDYPQESYDIVVVDNASTDRTRQVLSQRYPHIKLVPMESNAGFAVACNRGASESKRHYIAFLNNDAVADRHWLSALVETLRSSGESAVCAGARIMSREGDQVEFDGAASNLFGAGRPTSVWGWADSIDPPGKGSSVLFASGGAMLIERSVFLDVGGFDPGFFAYFEDVDLGWRLWALGYSVVYAPDAVVRHVGGATGKRTGEHRRYLLWECNSLATIIKNYETGNMEKVLSAALMLEYKRALMSMGDAINPVEYRLGARSDTNTANVERVPKVSVAHIAAIDRLNAMMPQLMASRREIQARRLRPDAAILPLLGRLFEPQYAGRPYAEASRALVRALNLSELVAPIVPNRVLVVATEEESSSALELAGRLHKELPVALAILGAAPATRAVQNGYAVHRFPSDDPLLARLAGHADLIIAMQGVAGHQALSDATAPVVIIGTGAHAPDHANVVAGIDDLQLEDICRSLR